MNKNIFYKMYGAPGGGRDVWHKVPFEKQMQTELLGTFAALKKYIIDEVYTEVPYLADAADVIDVTVKNAVRSPYFSAKPFHKTTLAEWKNVERNFKAPWADFQSEKFMMNVPTSWIYRFCISGVDSISGMVKIRTLRKQ